MKRSERTPATQARTLARQQTDFTAEGAPAPVPAGKAVPGMADAQRAAAPGRAARRPTPRAPVGR
jgi:hypothetical protein